VFLDDVSKTDADRITIGLLDTICSTISPGTPFILGWRSKVKVTSHKDIADVGRYTLVSAGFSKF